MELEVEQLQTPVRSRRPGTHRASDWPRKGITANRFV